jgi:hypothetical protein
MFWGCSKENPAAITNGSPPPDISNATLFDGYTIFYWDIGGQYQFSDARMKWSFHSSNPSKRCLFDSLIVDFPADTGGRGRGGLIGNGRDTVKSDSTRIEWITIWESYGWPGPKPGHGTYFGHLFLKWDQLEHRVDHSWVF